MSRSIVLCADDYGLSESVSQAILELAQKGRLSAISCMTGTPLWREHARRLADLKGKVDIGLHLTLADETPLTAMPRLAPGGRLPGIGPMILKSYAGRIDLDEVEAEVRAQLDAFTSVMGFAPSHIDGHLHAHVLPGIRDVVLRAARSVTPQPWLRSTSDSFAAIARRGVAVPKAAFIAALGQRFVTAAGDLAANMNDGFSGIYAFSTNRQPYGALFGRFVQSRARKHLVQCHPGLGGDAADVIGPMRAAEYKFLNSGAFPEYLAREDIVLDRLSEAHA
jgi:predicted glycoside hydrolase/deacetylase ChbG (UPF0249 family)